MNIPRKVNNVTRHSPPNLFLQEGNFNKQGLHQDATLKAWKGSLTDEETKPLLENGRQGQVNWVKCLFIQDKF